MQVPNYQSGMGMFKRAKIFAEEDKACIIPTFDALLGNWTRYHAGNATLMRNKFLLLGEDLLVI